jgi:hypothetical protein
MTIPKWLLPVLSIVAALAVGVAATLIGMRFASAEVHASPSKTSTAPLYGPLAEGEADSPQIGTGTGTLPGTDGSPVSGSRRHLIDEVLRSSDPGGTVRAATTGSDSTGSSAGSSGGSAPAGSPAPGGSAGDACSPPSGEPPAGCPDGIHGAIFASHMTPPLWVNAAVRPAATGASSSPRCASDPAPGHVTIGVASSLPADFTVSYWPTGDAANRQVARFSTDATQVAAFNAYYGGSSTGPSPVEYSCSVLHVDAATGYTAQVTAIDSLYRVAPVVSLLFSGGGAPLHPELEAYTVGDNLLFASALHASDETVEIKAVQRTAATADCNGSNAFAFYARTDDATVTADYLNEHQLLAADTHRASYAFLVPEGTDFILCARWFAAGHATSWQRTTPLYESRQSMSSPDTLEPTISLTSVAPAEGTGSVAISMNTSGGAVCGPNYTWTRTAGSDGGLPLPVELCSVGSYGGARTDSDRSRFWDLGTDDLMRYQFDISSTNGLSGGTAEGYFQLHVPCVGECRIPADEHYHLSLLDGGTRATDGHVDLVVHYTQGNHNGAGAWVVGGVQGLAPRYTPPAAPAFDTDAVATAGPVVGLLASSVTVRIASDRPVDYSMSAYEIDGSPTTCLRSGAGTVTGHLDAPGDVFLGGLCLGATYTVEVTLTDHDGHRSVWGSRGTDPNGWWPGNSVVTTPTVTGTLRYDFRAYGPAQSQISQLSVGLGSATVLGSSDPLNNSCHPAGIFNGQGATPHNAAQLGQHITLFVRFGIQQADSRCQPLHGSPAEYADVAIPLQLDQLDGSYDGVVVNSATGTPLWSIHLWFDQAPTP